jgi:ferric-dicitrate binding protein FerR (iron transport regulator)
MDDDRHILHAIRQATTPSEAAIRRTKLRALAQVGHADLVLRELGNPELAAISRVRRRALHKTPAPRRPPLWMPGLALAAAALFVLWNQSDSPDAPADMRTQLLADHPGYDTVIEPIGLSSAAQVALSPEVQLAPNGVGSATGTRGAPQINWRRGLLTVDVKPKHDIRLVVNTEEAQVTVLGTRFSVDRGPLGTTVQVERGKVQVDCVTAQAPRQSVLTGGDTVTCWPIQPARLLTRALALEVAGTAPDEVQESVEAGLLSATGHVRGELLALQFRLATRQGDGTEALRLARLYLSEGNTLRAEELSRHVQALELDAP